MAIPKGYRPIGPRYGKNEKAKAMREAKLSRKRYGDSYIVRPVEVGQYIVGYQMYWKRGR